MEIPNITADISLPDMVEIAAKSIEDHDELDDYNRLGHDGIRCLLMRLVVGAMARATFYRLTKEEMNRLARYKEGCVPSTTTN